MTIVGISPQFTDAPYLNPEPDFQFEENFFNSLLIRERLTATILNIKENAQYEKNELLTGQQWFSQSQGGAIVTKYTFRVVFDLVALNGGSIGAGLTPLSLSSTTMPPLLTYANGLNPVHIFGAATSGNNYLPLPYASASGSNIEIFFTNTSTTVQSININNAYGSSLTTAVVVMEYWKT